MTNGMQFIGGARVAASKETFASIEAATGAERAARFHQATIEEVALAAEAAAAAYPVYRQTSPSTRAAFLEAIADEIDALDDAFVETVMAESGLPEARIRGERGRTTGQLRLFANVVRRGDYIGARIDQALPDRAPLPRSDHRLYRIGMGPVAVFGASNFPLAFSAAGGDTASALAAGCPVVVKAHSSHPATGEAVGEAILRAAEKCGMPKGVFGMIFGARVGANLVQAPQIKAVGFTGSLHGGRALFDLANARPDPIPVFAEMSSINPVFMMPDKIASEGEAVATALADSVALGAGQFCTNPGLIIGFKGAGFDAFTAQLSTALAGKPPAVMLNAGGLRSYLDGLARVAALDGIETLGAGDTAEGRAHTCVFRGDASLLTIDGKPLEDEVFGPSTVVVALDDPSELPALVAAMNGHLTGSIFATDAELPKYADLIAALETRVGRVIFNQFPTGVEVCDAMVHGGPYPATSDSRGTSVGTLAIDRYLRPVCYQNCPDAALPEPLKDANPLGLKRLVNGSWSSDSL